MTLHPLFARGDTRPYTRLRVRTRAPTPVCAWGHAPLHPSAREDTRPYTLRAIDMNDLALVWPILRDLNQSGARGSSRALETMALSQGILR